MCIYKKYTCCIPFLSLPFPFLGRRNAEDNLWLTFKYFIGFEYNKRMIKLTGCEWREFKYKKSEVAVRNRGAKNQLETLKIGWTRIYIHTVRHPWSAGNKVLTSGASLYPPAVALCSPCECPDTTGLHTQNEKRLLSASQHFLSSENEIGDAQWIGPSLFASLPSRQAQNL